MTLAFFKSHIKAHTRQGKLGQVVNVREHDDKREAGKQPWERTQGEVQPEAAKKTFPIKGRVDIVDGKPIYTYSTTLKWGKGEKTFEIKGRSAPNGAEMAARLHKKVIEQAHSEGRVIPPEVLEDYPDLAKQVKKSFEHKEGTKPNIPDKGTHEELNALQRQY